MEADAGAVEDRPILDGEGTEPSRREDEHEPAAPGEPSGHASPHDPETGIASREGSEPEVPEPARPEPDLPESRRPLPPVEHERLDEADRIPDPLWAEIVQGFSQTSGAGTEMSRDEIAEALEVEDGYRPPDPGPIGVHTGPPLIVLCWILAVGGALALLFMTVVVRSVPPVLITVGVTALVLGVLGLFWQLPKHRDADGGDGAQV